MRCQNKNCSAGFCCIDANDRAQPRLVVGLIGAIAGDLQRANKDPVLSIGDGGAVRERRRRKGERAEAVATVGRVLVITSDEVELGEGAEDLDLREGAALVGAGEAEEGQATEATGRDGGRELDAGVDKVDAESGGAECQPPEQRGCVAVDEGVVGRRGLRVAGGVQKSGNRDTEELVSVIDDLLVLETSSEAEVADVECVRNR